MARDTKTRIVATTTYKNYNYRVNHIYIYDYVYICVYIYMCVYQHILT